MKLLLVHNHYQQPGGEDQVVAEEIALLHAHGHDVSTFFRHNDAIKDMSGLGVARRTLWNGQIARELTEQLRRERPEVVHFHNTFPLMSPAVLHAAKASGAAVVQTLHNFRLFCVNGLLYREGSPCERCVGCAVPIQGVIRRCYRNSLGASATTAAMIAAHRAMGTWRKNVDAFIALSDFARGRFISGGLPKDRLHVKPNFIDADPGMGAGAGGYVLYIGRLSQEKGLDTLVDAWPMTGGRLPLRIIGDGPKSDLVRNFVARHGNVQWLGRLGQQDVLAMLRDAMALIVPSNCYENFPRTIVEAYAAGTPVIAAGHGSLAEIVKHERTGLHFQAGNPEALAQTICRVAAEPGLLAPMRRAARLAFEQHYTASKNHDLLMGIYEQALARMQGAAPIPAMA